MLSRKQLKRLNDAGIVYPWSADQLLTLLDKLKGANATIAEAEKRQNVVTSEQIKSFCLESQEETSHDLDTCPSCGEPAEDGFEGSPPNPYPCEECQAKSRHDLMCPDPTPEMPYYCAVCREPRATLRCFDCGDRLLG